MKDWKHTKEILEVHQKKMLDTLDGITVDTHWFRRVFHTFAACFLIYYMLPDEPWINQGKQIVALLALGIIILLESLRLKGYLPTGHFFGLRYYEKNRPASYLYFGSALVLLLVFFPQQIAIPCILCGAFADPLMGETRNRYTQKLAILLGLLVCFLLFTLTWYTAPLWAILLVSIIGSLTAVGGELMKQWWIDDDFLIQILPAITISLLYLISIQLGVPFLPQELLHPPLLFW